MDPIIKQRWVDRLRSGRDTQTIGNLRRSTGEMCTLGVLCAIAVEDGVLGLPHDDDCGFQVEQTAGSIRYTENGNLPTSVMKWAGLDQDNPSLRYQPAPENGRRILLGRHIGEQTQFGVIALNDDFKLPFDIMAKLIDDQL